MAPWVEGLSVHLSGLQQRTRVRPLHPSSSDLQGKVISAVSITVLRSLVEALLSSSESKGSVNI